MAEKTKILLVFIYLNCLNLADCLFTLTVVKYFEGFHLEQNPLMRALLELHPFSFFFVKTLVVFVFSLWLYSKRANVKARIALYFGAIVYSALVFIWIFGLRILDCIYYLMISGLQAF